MALSHEVEWLSISATDFCNLNCMYCAPDVKKTGRKLDFPKLEAFFDFFSVYAKPDIRVSFTGGEPTLHPQILDMVDATNEAFVDPEVWIVTNGVMPLEKLEGLLERGASFSITFEGLPRFQDSERPFHDSRGSSGPALRTIKRILEEGPERLSLRMNLSTNKLGAEGEICDFLLNLGVRRISIGILIPYGRGSGYRNIDYLGCAEHFIDFYDHFLSEGLGTEDSKFSPAELDWSSCMGGISSFSLSVDAKVVTCADLINVSRLGGGDRERFVVGEVGKEGVSLDLDSIRQFREFADAVPEECTDCAVKRHCGGCPLHKKLVGGEYTFDRNFCEGNKLMMSRFCGTCRSD